MVEGPDVGRLTPGSVVAAFEVREALALEDRSLFALAGVILEGTPRVGMRAALEGEEDRFDEPVHGIEFVGREGGGTEGTRPALTFSYSGAGKLERWRAVDWPGRRLRLYWGR